MVTGEMAVVVELIFLPEREQLGESLVVNQLPWLFSNEGMKEVRRDVSLSWGAIKEDFKHPGIRSQRNAGYLLH